MKGFRVKCIAGDMKAADVTSLSGKPRSDIYQVRLFAGADPGDVELEVVLDRKHPGGGVEVVRLRASALSFFLLVEDTPDEEKTDGDVRILRGAV